MVLTGMLRIEKAEKKTLLLIDKWIYLEDFGLKELRDVSSF